MREVLFRGKRCDSGEWVKGYYIRADYHWHKNGIHKEWIALGASANGGWFALHNKYAVKPETVGQFIGLTDKNGKKIFEGDIVKVYGGSIWTSEVLWDDIWCRYVAKHSYGKILMDNRPFGEYEVIGNIHDNPELLEK